MTQLITILPLFFFSNDTSSIKTDTLYLPASVVVKQHSDLYINTDPLRYQYRQGFFCDFEDKINKGKKMRLNLGVGELQ
jgi:hypothetical protein